MMVPEIIQRSYNFPVVIIGQERLKQILFVPELHFIYNPQRRIVLGRKYVMDMDDNSAGKSRQDLQIFEQHIALRPYNMGRIDKQNVVTLKLRKQSYVDVLNPLADDRYACALEPWHLIGLDTDMLAIVRRILFTIPANRSQCQQ